MMESGDISIETSKSLSITCGEDMSIHCKGNFNLEAEKNVNIYASGKDSQATMVSSGFIAVALESDELRLIAKRFRSVVAERLR